MHSMGFQITQAIININTRQLLVFPHLNGLESSPWRVLRWKIFS